MQKPLFKAAAYPDRNSEILIKGNAFFTDVYIGPPSKPKIKGPV
jgi:hypothetical protein